MIPRHGNRLRKFAARSSKILAFARHELRDEQRAVRNSLIRIKAENLAMPGVRHERVAGIIFRICRAAPFASDG
jgi:hypothetical protein